MSNFTSILNKPMTAVEKPKPLPIGNYLCVVDGAPEITKIGEKQTDVVKVKFKILQPMDDVDPEMIAEAGGVAGKSVTATFFITEDALFRSKKFLNEDLGIDENKTLLEGFYEAQGQQVVVQISHRASKDGQEIYSEVKSTARP